MNYEAVQNAIAHIRAGKMIILVDDEDRENEGDLCFAAEKVTPEAINFMATYGRGLICLTLSEERIQQLQLPMMVEQNTSSFGTAFTVSIEARQGVATGISAKDRALTILAAMADDAKPDDLVRPGHVFPLRARDGGVLVRTGQTEGSVDLARLAGLKPAGVICEIMNEDGTMARMGDLERFSQQHSIPILTIAELIEYRLAHESLVRPLARRRVRHPRWGEITLHAYGTNIDEHQHLAITKEPLDGAKTPLVRMHSGYPLSNIFGDLFSNDRLLLNGALQKLGAEHCGVLVCLNKGEPEIPLDERIRQLGTTAAEGREHEHEHESEPQPQPQQDGVLREFGIGAQILRDLGLHRIRLLSNKPKRLVGLEGYGLEVEEIIPIPIDKTLIPTPLEDTRVSEEPGE